MSYEWPERTLPYLAVTVHDSSSWQHGSRFPSCSGLSRGSMNASTSPSFGCSTRFCRQILGTSPRMTALRFPGVSCMVDGIRTAALSFCFSIGFFPKPVPTCGSDVPAAVWLLGRRRLFLEHARQIAPQLYLGALAFHDDALLEDRQQIVPRPVDNQPCRHGRQHEGKDQRHPVEEHRLGRVRRRRV